MSEADRRRSRGVSKRFVKPLDLAARAANLFGAGLHEAVVHAVDDVDLVIGEGEVVGLVGESGCGKSTLGRVVAGIDPPERRPGELPRHGARRARRRSRRKTKLKLQMIFQDPMASLNPRMRVVDIIGEAPVVHGIVPAAEQQDYVDALLLRVGLDPAYRGRYPHQFSGGQRARIGIARALAVRPEFLVCDEPVAALDVSIQAQVLNLFIELRNELRLTYLFISHDLAVVEHLSDRVVIMYLGRVVEIAASEELFRRPNHPYTQGAARQCAAARGAQAALRADDRRDPLAVPPAARLPFPSALSACDAALPQRAPGAQADRAWAFLSLPSQRRKLTARARCTSDSRAS